MQIEKPMDAAAMFPVRKSRKQKQQFRAEVSAYLERLGYTVTTEKAGLGARNVVAGDPEGAKYLVTAHYDTCARMLLPNLLTPFSPVFFGLYQIFVAIGMLLPAFVLGGFVEMALDSYWAGYWVSLGLMLLTVVFMMAGPANPTNCNDNTSGVVTVLEIARSLPRDLRQDVCFVLFDLEEAGLIGSHGYRKAHKKSSSSQLVLNLDCVGDGDEIVFLPSSRIRKDAPKLAKLERICGPVGRKRIWLHQKGFHIYPSDQAQFPYGVGICALHKGRAGRYLSRIHTSRDTILEETNVNILRAALITMMSSRAGE